MKGFIHSMIILLLYLITMVIVSWILIDFSNMQDFFVYIGELVGLVSICYCIGSGGAWGVLSTIDKIKARHKKRFMWYYRMGLYESAVLAEPKFAKKFWAWNW